MKKWICAVLIVTDLSLRGDTIVVPNKYTDVDGPEAGLIFLQPGQDRIQQVYDSSDFANIPPGGILISNFSWRVDQHSGSAFDITFDDVEVRASTTSRTSSSLDPVFSNNTGLDETLTRSPSGLRLTSAYTSTGPDAFSITFPFDHPFYYNPSAGNLLIDVDLFHGFVPSMPLLDLTAHGEGIGLVVEGAIFNTDNQGFVTQFVFQSIPEPSCIWLFGLGGLAITLKRFF
jgi:hypothetical protein